VPGSTDPGGETGRPHSINGEGTAERCGQAFPDRAGNEGAKFETVNTVYPNVYDGVEGMLFITRCVASSREDGKWVPFRHPKSRK